MQQLPGVGARTAAKEEAEDEGEKALAAFGGPVSFRGSGERQTRGVPLFPVGAAGGALRARCQQQPEGAVSQAAAA